MKRWTTTGFPECECERCSAECDDPMMGVCWVRGAVNRLAAYEDTDMTPADIVAMRKELESRKSNWQEEDEWGNKIEHSHDGIYLITSCRGSTCEFVHDHTDI